MKIDIPTIQKYYFTFDMPVPYSLADGNTIDISSILLKDSVRYDSASVILLFDKNSSPNIEDIQMPYLAFLYHKIFAKEAEAAGLLGYILTHCIGLVAPSLRCVDNKVYIIDNSNGLKITAKEFDDISKIILYQNNIHYDDTYIDPDFRKAMQEVDELRNRDYVQPNLERKIAIVTSHCGLSKAEQMQMTYRSHQILFEECAGEVEFTTIRPIALFGGKANELEHWIWNRKKNKFQNYITSVDSYNKSMGGDGKVATVHTSQSDQLVKQFEQQIGG